MSRVCVKNLIRTIVNQTAGVGAASHVGMVTFVRERRTFYMKVCWSWWGNGITFFGTNVAAWNQHRVVGGIFHSNMNIIMVKKSFSNKTDRGLCLNVESKRFISTKSSTAQAQTDAFIHYSIKLKGKVHLGIYLTRNSDQCLKCFQENI